VAKGFVSHLDQLLSLPLLLAKLMALGFHLPHGICSLYFKGELRYCAHQTESQGLEI